jgi:alpha-galactosidase
MTAICRAIRRETSVPVVGLCHGVSHVENQIARFLGAEPGSVTSLGVGLNHLTFLTQLFLHGQDAAPMIRERLAEQRRTLEQEIAAKDEWPNIVPEGRTPRYADDPFSWGVFEAHGVFPCAMDRHAVEFFPELFPGGRYHGRLLGRQAFPIDKRIALGDQWYAEMLALARSPEPLPQDRWDNLPGESEQLLQIMHALLGDGRGVFSVNIPNRGQAPFLPRDAIIECNASATGAGFVPLLADNLPEPLVEKLRAKLRAVELTVEAAVRGDREAMLEAMLADGGVTDPEQARALRDDLLAAHRDHLPQFA